MSYPAFHKQTEPNKEMLTLTRQMSVTHWKKKGEREQELNREKEKLKAKNPCRQAWLDPKGPRRSVGMTSFIL